MIRTTVTVRYAEEHPAEAIMIERVRKILYKVFERSIDNCASIDGDLFMIEISFDCEDDPKTIERICEELDALIWSKAFYIVRKNVSGLRSMSKFQRLMKRAAHEAGLDESNITFYDKVDAGKKQQHIFRFFDPDEFNDVTVVYDVNNDTWHTNA